MTDALTWQTRLHFADLDQRCIDDALNGSTPVNDIESYISWRNASISNGMAGKYDHTFAFRQYRNFLATGECVPLLT